MNAVAFYFLGAVAIAAAAAAVTLPHVRALAAGWAYLVALGVFLIAAGADGVGLVLLAAALGVAVVVRWTPVVESLGLEDASLPPFIGGWLTGVVVAAVCGVCLVGVLAAHTGDWLPQGPGGGTLASVFHYRELMPLLVLVLVVGVAVAGVLVLARTSGDERAHDEELEARRRKLERMERRRADREAARLRAREDRS